MFNTFISTVINTLLIYGLNHTSLDCLLDDMFDIDVSIGPGKLLMGGVPNFAYLRPQNHPISVQNSGFEATFGDLCPKICVFEGIFLPSYQAAPTCPQNTYSGRENV